MAERAKTLEGTLLSVEFDLPHLRFYVRLKCDKVPDELKDLTYIDEKGNLVLNYSEFKDSNELVNASSDLDKDNMGKRVKIRYRIPKTHSFYLKGVGIVRVLENKAVN